MSDPLVGAMAAGAGAAAAAAPVVAAAAAVSVVGKGLWTLCKEVYQRLERLSSKEAKLAKVKIVRFTRLLEQYNANRYTDSDIETMLKDMQKQLAEIDKVNLKGRGVKKKLQFLLGLLEIGATQLDEYMQGEQLKAIRTVGDDLESMSVDFRIFADETRGEFADAVAERQKLAEDAKAHREQKANDVVAAMRVIVHEASPTQIPPFNGDAVFYRLLPRTNVWEAFELVQPEGRGPIHIVSSYTRPFGKKVFMSPSSDGNSVGVSPEMGASTEWRFLPLSSAKGNFAWCFKHVDTGRFLAVDKQHRLYLAEKAPAFWMIMATGGGPVHLQLIEVSQEVGSNRVKAKPVGIYMSCRFDGKPE